MERLRCRRVCQGAVQSGLSARPRGVSVAVYWLTVLNYSQDAAGAKNGCRSAHAYLGRAPWLKRSKVYLFF